MFFHKKKESGPFYNINSDLVIYVQSEGGTLFRSYLRKGYDFRLNYGKGSRILFDKELIGITSNDKVSVHAEFDANYKLFSSEIHGGRFLTPTEYEELLRSKEEKRK